MSIRFGWTRSQAGSETTDEDHVEDVSTVLRDNAEPRRRRGRRPDGPRARTHRDDASVLAPEPRCPRVRRHADDSHDRYASDRIAPRPERWQAVFDLHARGDRDRAQVAQAHRRARRPGVLPRDARRRGGRVARARLRELRRVRGGRTAPADASRARISAAPATRHPPDEPSSRRRRTANSGRSAGQPGSNPANDRPPAVRASLGIDRATCRTKRRSDGRSGDRRRDHRSHSHAARRARHRTGRRSAARLRSSSSTSSRAATVEAVAPERRRPGRTTRRPSRGGRRDLAPSHAGRLRADRFGRLAVPRSIRRARRRRRARTGDRRRRADQDTRPRRRPADDDCRPASPWRDTPSTTSCSSSPTPAPSAGTPSSNRPHRAGRRASRRTKPPSAKSTRTRRRARRRPHELELAREAARTADAEVAQRTSERDDAQPRLRRARSRDRPPAGPDAGASQSEVDAHRHEDHDSLSGRARSAPDAARDMRERLAESEAPAPARCRNSPKPATRATRARDGSRTSSDPHRRARIRASASTPTVAADHDAATVPSCTAAHRRSTKRRSRSSRARIAELESACHRPRRCAPANESDLATARRGPPSWTGHRREPRAERARRIASSRYARGQVDVLEAGLAHTSSRIGNAIGHDRHGVLRDLETARRESRSSRPQLEGTERDRRRSADQHDAAPNCACARSRRGGAARPLGVLRACIAEVGRGSTMPG